MTPSDFDRDRIEEEERADAVDGDGECGDAAARDARPRSAEP